MATLALVFPGVAMARCPPFYIHPGCSSIAHAPTPDPAPRHWHWPAYWHKWSW